MKLTFSGINRALLVFVGLTFSVTAGAQDLGFKVRPGLARNDSKQTVLALNLAFNIGDEKHDASESFQRSIFYRGNADASFFLRHASTNPENQEISVSTGFEVSLSKVADVGPSADPDAAEALEFDWGALGLGLSGKYESSQDWQEQGLNFGAELRYTAPEGGPGLIINYSAVVPLKSEIRDQMTEDLKTISRLDASVYWLTPRIKDRVSFTLHLRAFRSFSLREPLKAALQDGIFFRAGVIYQLNANLKVVQLDNVFIKRALGRLPTESEDHKAWTIGVELSPEN